MRVVLDTSVVASAFRSRNGTSFQVLRLVAAAKLLPLATPALFLEYENVLKRQTQRARHGLSLDEIDQALSALAKVMKPVEVWFAWRPQLNDAADEMVLEGAVNGRADALVTHNQRDFARAAARFGMPVLSPGALLVIMRHG